MQRRRRWQGNACVSHLRVVYRDCRRNGRKRRSILDGKDGNLARRGEWLVMRDLRLLHYKMSAADGKGQCQLLTEGKHGSYVRLGLLSGGSRHGGIGLLDEGDEAGGRVQTSDPRTKRCGLIRHVGRPPAHQARSLSLPKEGGRRGISYRSQLPCMRIAIASSSKPGDRIVYTREAAVPVLRKRGGSTPA